ncbi:MAG TPA: hypothetical protein DIU00_15785 [Phycisphaerales bacterium]|nr:hypothetical protein [Phycisphaerales bacterium]
MSKAESDKQSEDIRRKKSSKKTSPQPAANKAQLINGSSAESEKAMQEKSGIPKFDLAEQIMAEQRKITAIRRKGPGKLTKPPKKLHPAESIAHNFEPHPILSGQGQIIADIVARDIEKFCKGKA